MFVLVFLPFVFVFVLNINKDSLKLTVSHNSMITCVWFEITRNVSKTITFTLFYVLRFRNFNIFILINIYMINCHPYTDWLPIWANFICFLYLCIFTVETHTIFLYHLAPPVSGINTLQIIFMYMKIIGRFIQPFDKSFRFFVLLFFLIIWRKNIMIDFSPGPIRLLLLLFLLLFRVFFYSFRLSIA